MKPTEMKLPEEQINIELPKEIAEKLDPIAMKIGEQFKIYGFRAKINFRSLLKCLAFRNGRSVVTEEEFKESLELANFMNFKFTPM